MRKYVYKRNCPHCEELIENTHHDNVRICQCRVWYRELDGTWTHGEPFNKKTET